MEESKFVIIDKINIKSLVETIATYLRNNGLKQYTNLRSFYSSLLKEIGEDIKDSYLNRILKYMSSDKSSTINIIEDLSEEVYDNELKKFFNKLVSTIESLNNKSKIYEQLYLDVDFVFFEDQELFKIKEAYEKEKFEDFIFYLFKHAFINYKNNMPNIAGKRIFLEALTINSTSYIRNSLMKISADLGCEEAARLYADYIFKENKDEAILYYLKDQNNPSSLWSIAHSFEINSISKETKFIVKKQLEDILKTNDFIDKIKISNTLFAEDLLDSIKLYWYLIEKYNFQKAYNSIGKLLIFKTIKYGSSYKESIEIGKKYLKSAIMLGNVNSMTNYAIYLINNKNDPEYTEELVYRYLKKASELADPYANYYYGQILSKEGNFEEALTKLLLSSKAGLRKADYEIAKIYQKSFNYDEAIEYYKKSILKNYIPAVYDLCLLYYKLFMTGEKMYNGYQVICKELYNEYFEKLTDSQKKDLNKIMDSFN